MFLRRLLLFFTACGLLFFQVHPFLPFTKEGIRPDFILFLVVYLGLVFPPGRGAFFCFVLGYCFEFLSGANSGLYIAIYLSAFVSIKISKKYFNFDTLAERFLLFLGCVFVKFFVMAFCFEFVYEYGWQILGNLFFQEALFTIVLFPFVFPLIIRVNKNGRSNTQTENILRNGINI